jgi:hypothetical protein
MRQTRRISLAITLLSPALALICLALCPGAISAQPAANELPGLQYDLEFFPGTDYDPEVPTPEDCLGFRLGDRAALPLEIERCLQVWGKSSKRARLEEYARSFEDRALYTMVITSPANQARLAEIRSGWERVGDPRGASTTELSRMLDELPAVAWIAYSIHGDETSGSDASLAVIHHLAAGRGEALEELLEEVVVVIDPMQNPDGRNRFLQMVAENRSSQPNVDDQSLIHDGYWPWGRTNHYGFDLNRDWVLGVNPESRGRIRTAGAWHPLLVVDAHEMGSQDTYLFSPPREPRSPYVSPQAVDWGPIFARDQAQAFDERGWVYYTGEWNEGWYAGYTDTWGELRGVVGILYEQAGFAEDGVRRPEGTIHTYRESVHHQAISTLANLETLRANAGDIKKDFLADRLAAVDPRGRYAEKTFAVLPTANRGRLDRFLDLMRLEGIELYTVDEPFVVDSAVDQLGRQQRRVTVPADTVLIPNRQPLARLVAAMLDFDPRMPEEYLRRERKEILRNGSSSIYDVTAWNLTMMHGLTALRLEAVLPATAKPLAEVEPVVAAAPDAMAVAWIIDGADDDSVAVAARLMDRGVQLRIADKKLELDGQRFARGSLVVLPIDNRRFAGDLATTVTATAAEMGLAAAGVGEGLGEGHLPDLGGGHFRRLEPPSIGLFTRGGLSVYDFGSLWHTLDQRLGVRHSHLDLDGFRLPDLRRYNVLILPDRWSGSLPEAALETLAKWVEAGGTLIAVGRSAAQLAGAESGLSDVRLLRDSQADLDRYEQAVLREWQAARREIPDVAAIWSYSATGSPDFPWSADDDLARPSTEELERRDRWQRQFMPQGAILATRADTEHWLTFGTDETMPLLYGSSRVLMTDGEAPVRIGVFAPTSDESDAPAQRAGWSLLPAGAELQVRMSGLVWPEAVQRLANGAAVTRESSGRGQVILFAVPPTFRSSTLASERLLANAIVYGPGLGARTPIEP